MLKRIYFVLPLLLWVASFTACSTTSSIEREVSTAQDRVVTEQEAAKAVDGEFQTKNLIYDDPANQRMLSDMVARLVKTSHNPKANFTVRLVKQNEPNAFSVGGQYVYVTAGLLKFANGDKDMLAGILGHEISHDFAGHQDRKGTVEAWKDMAVSLIGNKSAQTAAGLTANLFTLKYSRAYEREADILGAVYTYRAGYDPRGLNRFFEKMSKQGGGIPTNLSFLSTHPSDPSRIQNINLVIQFLKKELTVDEIAAIDPKTADVLRAVVQLDQRS